MSDHMITSNVARRLLATNTLAMRFVSDQMSNLLPSTLTSMSSSQIKIRGALNQIDAALCTIEAVLSLTPDEGEADQ